MTLPDVEVRELLMAQRARTTAQIASLRRDVESIIASSADVATDDEHDSEGTTIAFERAQAGALLDQARHHLDDLDTALARLDEGRYGVCDRCGGRIGAERLEARPAARTCIKCATATRS